MSAKLPHNAVINEAAREIFIYDMKPREFAMAVSRAEDLCRANYGAIVKTHGEPLLLASQMQRGARTWSSGPAERFRLNAAITAVWFDGRARIVWNGSGADYARVSLDTDPFAFVFPDLVEEAGKRAEDELESWVMSSFQASARNGVSFLWSKQGRLWAETADGVVIGNNSAMSFFATGRPHRFDVALIGGNIWRGAVGGDEQALAAFMRKARVHALCEEASIMRSRGDSINAAVLEIQAAALREGQQ